jgi:hypothetical protein
MTLAALCWISVPMLVIFILVIIASGNENDANY